MSSIPTPSSPGSRRYAANPMLLRGTGAGPGPLTERYVLENRTMLHVLAGQVAERPDQDWLVFDSRDRLTFRQAQQRAYQFAAAATASEFPSPRVALLLRNQHEFIPAYFGAQAAGGFAVPLNPELRGPLLETLLARSEAQLLVVREDLVDVLRAAPSLAQVRLVLVCGEARPDAAIHGVPVRPLEGWLGGHPATPPPFLPKLSDLAALVFTSGTSGGSKAVAWSHHYQYFSSSTICDSLGHAPGDILSTPLQLCHIAGLQVFANSALHAGCTAHLKSAFSAARWWDEIAADKATFAMLMGQMAEMVLTRVPAAPPHQLANVYILPQPAHRAEFEERYRTRVIWQGWGMTEIFPHVPSKSRLEQVSDDTIGPPPSWVDFGVVDDEDRMLAPGELGQMVYRPLLPYAMASGYYGDTAATAAAFRNFMFHTGDLGYYDDLGNIHFVMRNQDAIRRRGENVSAVELETIARRHPEVADAAAYGIPSPIGEQEVKLDVVSSDDLPIDLGRLHQWLTQNLPRFMVPRYLEQRKAFPKTPSQRVEKYKLAQDPVDRREVCEFQPPPRKGAAGVSAPSARAT